VSGSARLRRAASRVRIALMRSALALVMVVCTLGLVAGCGGDDEGSDSVDTTTATTGGETGDAANGEQVFVAAGCGGCHSFSKAGSNGSVGPDLDDAAPSFDHVVTQVTNGGGTMPAFGDELSEQEIRDVAAFVSGS
jgi:mono/diheme cytochrome c family protein